MFGHTDFFKHNVFFAPTNRQMVESVSQNAQRIRQYGIDEGSLEVEKFLDAVLSVSDHIDPYPRREPPEPRRQADHAAAAGHDGGFSDLFPTAPGTTLASGRPLKGERKGKARRGLPEPEKDLLRFLLEHADHLDDWQRDIIGIVREESLLSAASRYTRTALSR